MDDGTHRELRVDAVWDIETEGWDKFVAGALWTREDGLLIYDHTEEDAFAGALLELPKGHVAWAHAGGRFDVLWLLDWCYRHDCLPRAQIRMSGSSISALALAGGATFRDSHRLIPMPLKKATQIFGTAPKADLGLPCRCGNDCGGYCSISRRMARGDKQRMLDYMARDVEALRDTLFALVSYCADHRLELRGTVASSSWASASLMCGLVDADWDLRGYRHARRGYYGGRCEVGMVEAPTVYRYDRQAAYPAALREPVPCGEPSMVEGRKAARLCASGRPGIYDAIVDVPESHAPPLPLRCAERIVYPHGVVRGSWTLVELERALEVGCEVIDVTAGIVWPDERPLLKPYVEHVWELRAGADTKELGQWLKWLANSLTGAFAQDPEQDIFAIGDKADDPRWSMVGDHDWLWRRTMFRIPSRAHVHWAATLTARARVELHREIEHSGPAWVYSDTDSDIATRKLTRGVGLELGEWKFEGIGRNFHALAPKLYRYDTDDGPVARAKGIPNAARVWDKLAAGEDIPITSGVTGFLRAAAGGGPLFSRVNTSRSIHPREGWIGGRIRVGNATRAPSVDDLASLPR